MPEISVTIRNLSSINAVNVQVAVYMSTFGIGMPRTLAGSQTRSVAGGQQQVLLFPVSQAVLNAPDPRIGAFVEIVHPHDRRLINNRGAQLLADAYTSAVGRIFAVSFPVLNNSSVARQITLSALGNDLNAAVVPATRAYAPGEQVVASVSLTVPAGIHGTSANPVRRDVTIVGRDPAGALINGLTYVIWIDN